MSRFPKLALLALVACAPALSSGPAAADLAKWDQARVTELAQQLSKACNAWWMSVQEQPVEEIGSGTDWGLTGLERNAEGLYEQSQGLAGHLAKGKGYAETRNMYRSIKETVDDIVVQIGQTDLDEQSQDAWAKVAGLVQQIGAYYEAGASGEPALGSGE